MYRLLCLELNQDIWTLSRHPKAHPLSKQIRLSSHFFFLSGWYGGDDMSPHQNDKLSFKRFLRFQLDLPWTKRDASCLFHCKMDLSLAHTDPPLPCASSSIFSSLVPNLIQVTIPLGYKKWHWVECYFMRNKVRCRMVDIKRKSFFLREKGILTKEMTL